MRQVDPRAIQLLVALLVAVAGAFVYELARKGRARLTARMVQRRGKKGEVLGEKLLRKKGFRTVSRQARASYEALVEGEKVGIEICADLVVERAGIKYVAEVKTGDKAPRFDNADTRRQLLEYQLAYGVKAVLLVDPEAGRIREVRFPLTNQVKKSTASLLWLAGFSAMVAALGWWLRR